MYVFLYILIALVALFVVLALFAPKSYDVNRSIVIKRPISEVFQYLKLIRNQDHWSPWKKKDPNMHQEFIGTDGEPGFISKWEGNKDVGMGEQELIKIIDNEKIESQLRFLNLGNQNLMPILLLRKSMN